MVIELEEKERKASSVPENLISFIMKCIRTIRDAGGIINTAVVIAAALGIIKPILLECNRGHIVLLVKFCETEGYYKKAQGHSIKF